MACELGLGASINLSLRDGLLSELCTGSELPLEVVLDVVGQRRMSDVRRRFVRGVVQCAHARDARCRS